MTDYDYQLAEHHNSVVQFESAEWQSNRSDAATFKVMVVMIVSYSVTEGMVTTQNYTVHGQNRAAFLVNSCAFNRKYILRKARY